MKHGDVVALKNGGEKMVVVNPNNMLKNGHRLYYEKNQINNDLVETIWVDSSGKLNNQCFHLNELRFYH